MDPPEKAALPKDQEVRIQERSVSPLRPLLKLDTIEDLERKGSEFGSIPSITSSMGYESDTSASKAGAKRVGFAQAEVVIGEAKKGKQLLT